MYKALNNSTYQTGDTCTCTRTHELDPVGSLFRPFSSEGRRAEGRGLFGYLPASCGFTGPALVELGVRDGNGDPSSSAPTQNTMVGLEPMTQTKPHSPPRPQTAIATIPAERTLG